MKEPISAEYGFSIHYFLAAFNDTFYKSSYKDFKKFFLDNKDVKKWMICSDYAIGDKNKKNDIVTFTFYPYIVDYQVLQRAIKVLAPKDLKNTKTINEDFLSFIKEAPILNISVALSRKRKLDYINNERDSFEISIDMLIKQLQYWIISTPENSAYYEGLIKKMNELKRLVKSPSTNLKIIRDIEIISQLVAYLCLEINLIIDVELLGWFSDRDKLLEYKKVKFKSPIIFDFIGNLYHVLCENHSDKIKSKAELIYGVPEQDGTLWYDELNKIPDYICGTLADYDSQKNKISHEKFNTILTNFFMNNPKNLIFKLDFSKKEFSTKKWFFYEKEIWKQ